MPTRWGTKGSNRSKGGNHKATVPWDLLGLRDPATSSVTPSIDDMRRQIISASHAGLSPDTVARGERKTTGRQSASRQEVSIQPRKVRS